MFYAAAILSWNYIVAYGENEENVFQLVNWTAIEFLNLQLNLPSDSLAVSAFLLLEEEGPGARLAITGL